MSRTHILGLAALAALVATSTFDVAVPRASAQAATAEADTASPYDHALARWQQDIAAMEAFRPGYAFWQHIFTIPDGSIAFGSASDGRLLAAFPTRGDWIRGSVWEDPALAAMLRGRQLPRGLTDRRETVATLLEAAVGPVVHNPTRGQFLRPNARRYGGFLSEWGAIYERFAVPAEIGLAQVIIESGLNGTRRSEARAVGFCQWLETNWKQLNRLSPEVIEAHNQTTQAPYCAAYLSVLATKYGSFIPALSEHHAGGTNVGRILITGARLGAEDPREQYFLGADFSRDLRDISLMGYRDIYRTYGPRSYLYSEMVFGNMFNVRNLIVSTPQAKIFAMRAPRAIPLAQITRSTGLSADEVRRYNPALVKQVPARANLYLPSYVKAFGPDVSFWHRPASAAYTAVLNDFVRLDATLEQWDDPAFEPVLRGFQRRFRETQTEEGSVMATMLAFVIQEAYTSGRTEILAEFRSSEKVLRLFQRGMVERDAYRLAQGITVCSSEETC
jgi:hypothetical protein